jgi:hypothetical protein
MSRENPTFEQYVERHTQKTWGKEYRETVDRQVVTTIKGALFSDPGTNRMLTENPLGAATAIAVENPQEMQVVLTSLAKQEGNGLISRIGSAIEQDSGVLRVSPSEALEQDPELSTMVFDVRNGVSNVLTKASEELVEAGNGNK